MDDNRKRSIAILGSTGSIGTQALEVIEEHSDKFEVYALTANNNADLLISQARKFNPEFVVIANENKYAQVKEALADLPIKVYAGADALADVVQAEPIDIVLASMVGYAGLRPTMNAIRAGKAIALANKESLVIAGDIVMERARIAGTPIIPVDSEHSAIFQSLQGCQGKNQIKRLILTASGGPFFGKSREELSKVTLSQALKHPNWSMGAKITIDSATMMNKGLELIEAAWLFGMKAADIDILVHRQSIIHSLVEYVDNSVIAQLGVPDMRIPIQYALTYPDRFESPVKQLDLAEAAILTFEKPDYETFTCINLCRRAIEQGGLFPAAVNAANEKANELFREGKIGFLDIPKAVEAAFDCVKAVSDYTLEDVFETDIAVRKATERLFI